MRKAVFAALIVFWVAGFASMARAEALHEGNILYARYALRGTGKMIPFHNMSAAPVLIPLGTEVMVIGVTKAKIAVQRMDNSEKYIVFAASDYWDKFFVKDKGEIDLGMLSDADKQIMGGMTKEQVYLSKGCPAYIGYGIKSNMHSLSEVMKSDIWYYNINSRIKDAVITFKDGRVTGAIDRTTKVKIKMDALKEKR